MGIEGAWSNQIENQVIIVGPGGQLLVYDPKQQFGDLIAAISGAFGSDGLGNTYEQGIGSYNQAAGVGTVLNGGALEFVDNLGSDTLAGVFGVDVFAGAATDLVREVVQTGLVIGASSNNTDAIVYLAPSGDTTGATDPANIAACFAVVPYVILLPGAWYADQPILVGAKQTLAGCGPATVINGVSSFSGSYLIELANPATTYQVTIKNMTLIPGILSGTTLSGPGGIQIDNTGWPGSTVTIEGSVRHVLDNIVVFNSGGDSFHLDNLLRDCLFTRLSSFRSAGCGFYVGAGSGGGGVTDSHFTNCVTGFSANHGFLSGGANNLFTSCKSYLSGANFYNATVGSTQCGFEITSSLGAGSRNIFNGCQAQQNGLYGFDLQSVDSCAVIGCESDSNGASTAVVVAGAGINYFTSTNCSIVGNVGTQEFTPGNQLYGILSEGGVSTGTWIAANGIQGTSGSFHFIAGSGYILLDELVVDLTGVKNQVKVGIFEMAEEATVQTLVNGSTIPPNTSFGTYAVDNAGAVTGIILDALTLKFGGQMVNIVNQGPGTVTFAAAGTSNVADGVADVIQPLQAATFVWDATTALWFRTY